MRRWACPSGPTATARITPTGPAQVDAVARLRGRRLTTNDNDGEEGWIAPSRPPLRRRRWPSRSGAGSTRRRCSPRPRRPLTPGDILILVRSRGELASLIVARLFAEGVPVAGIDRLHLSKPLAVKDLLAAIGFAVQPLDDLNLANLLVSPLIGWTRTSFTTSPSGAAGALWPALVARAGEGGHIAEAHEQLGALLAMADFTTPARFLETILSGPLDGRRKLLRRLGMAARDPIEELLSSRARVRAHEIASLDRFLAWFARGDVEIKRDPSAPSNAVRVMTVHGAKGLEAPVVILADATSDPAQDRRRQPHPRPADARRGRQRAAAPPAQARDGRAVRDHRRRGESARPRGALALALRRPDPRQRAAGHRRGPAGEPDRRG